MQLAEILLYAHKSDCVENNGYVSVDVSVTDKDDSEANKVVGLRTEYDSFIFGISSEDTAAYIPIVQSAIKKSSDRQNAAHSELPIVVEGMLRTVVKNYNNMTPVYFCYNLIKRTASHPKIAELLSKQKYGIASSIYHMVNIFSYSEVVSIVEKNTYLNALNATRTIVDQCIAANGKLKETIGDSGCVVTVINIELNCFLLQFENQYTLPKRNMDIIEKLAKMEITQEHFDRYIDIVARMIIQRSREDDIGF